MRVPCPGLASRHFHPSKHAPAHDRSQALTLPSPTIRMPMYVCRVQMLLEAAGGSGSFYVLEQLDTNADGEITLAEFEEGLRVPLTGHTHVAKGTVIGQRV